MTGSAEGAPPLGANPYVGPRPFESGEKLYGREREIRELDNLLAAERIVLLHSPSGAGKSSLVQAGLLPQLKRAFDIWGPTRMYREPSTRVGNRYVLSVIEGFEGEVPDRLRRSPEALAGQRLLAYVEGRPRRRSAPRNVLLVFDQFEEILTVDPLGTLAKHVFFDQLGELLRQPWVWALFVLREDFLAPLDAYSRQVPTHLKNRFRLDFLSLRGAREAIAHPAQERGRGFPAVEQLVYDLATTKVQQADGSFVEQTGEHVEPVQLQVVCRRLWDQIPPQTRSIGAQDLQQFGDVSEALAAYFADSVTRVADGEIVRERAIRSWFGEELITAGGIRTQVLRGVEESAGLDNEIIQRLLDTHLVRAEKRAGATWYELAHDRLIEPILDDNASWREKNLSDVQRRAELWQREDHAQGLLLTGEELVAGERWAAANKAELTEIEHRFLAAARQAQETAERDREQWARERRQARRIRRLGIAALIVGTLALAASAVAVVQWQKAEEQKAEAESQRQEALRQRDEANRMRDEAERERRRAEEEKSAAERAWQEAQTQEEHALEQKALAEEREQEALTQRERAELARQEADRARRETEQRRREAEEQRHAAQQQKDRAEHERVKAEEAEGEARRLRMLAEAKALAVRTASLEDSQQRSLLALQAYRLHRSFGGEEEDPEIYDALRLAREGLSFDRSRLLPGHPAEIRSLAVAPDGRRLATGDEAGEVCLIRLQPNVTGAVPVGQLGSGVRAIAFGADGRELAAGSFGGAVRVWALPANDGKVVAATQRVIQDSGFPVNALVFQPRRTVLAAGSAGGGLRLFDLSAVGTPATVLLDAERAMDVRALAFSPDGALLVAADHGRGIWLWDAEQPGEAPRRLADDPHVRSVAFGPDGRFLAAGTDSAQVLVWPWQPGKREPATREPQRLAGHSARVETVVFHPRRPLLASASLDGTVRLWDVQHPDALPRVLSGHDAWVWTAVFTPDGESLISSSRDRTVRLWPTRSEALAEEICGSVERNLTHEEWAEYLPAELTYEKTCPQLERSVL